MKQFFALTKKSRKIAAVLLTVALLLGSFAAIPASAKNADADAWSPLHAIAVDSAGAVTLASDSAFKWGATEGDTYVELTSVTATATTTKGDITFASAETDMSYVVHKPVTDVSANGNSTTTAVNYINVNLTETAGMKLGFVAPKDGKYYVTTLLSVPQDNTVTYRAVLNGEIITEGTNAGVSGSWGDIQVNLAQGETLWLEAESDAAVTINIGAPLFSYVEVTENEDGTVTESYAYHNYSRHTTNGRITGTSGRYVFGPEGIQKNNLWDIKGHKIAVADETTGAYAISTTRNLTRTTINSTDTSYNYTSANDSMASNLTYRPIYNATEGRLYMKQNYGATFTFTMPVDGNLELENIVRPVKDNYAALRYRVLVNPTEEERVDLSNWLSVTEDDSGVDMSVTVGDLSKGDEVLVQLFNTATLTSAAYVFQGTEPVAKVTYDPNAQEPEVATLYGDANGDDKVSILDLIRVKKALAGVEGVEIDNEANIDVDGDGVDADDLALLGEVLLGITTYADGGYVIA